MLAFADGMRINTSMKSHIKCVSGAMDTLENIPEYFPG
jgi:hypothetical protein